MDEFSTSQLLTWVDAAVRAPSIHNTQPWLFLPRPDGVEVHSDPSRRLPAVDPEGRAMHISLGAAIFNLRIAVACAGRRPDVELLPTPGDRRHVATVHVGEPYEAGLDERELCVAIERRHSNRRAFDDTRPPREDLEAIRAAAGLEDAALYYVTADERDVLLGLARSAEDRMRRHAAYRDELRIWTTGDPYRNDGVPLEAVGPWSRPGSLPVRDYAPEREVPGRATVVYERDPTVAVVSTAGDDPRQWLVAGQALERVLLEITRRGLAASMFTQPLEDPQLRGLLRERGLIFGHAPFTTIQVVLRLGYGFPAHASPRRPPDEVIVHDRPVPMRPPRLG